MSGENWTPGPWRVVIDDDGNPLSGRPSVGAAEEYDCTIVHWDGFVQEYWRSARGDKEIHANAHLIAAAPELYEALEPFGEHAEDRAADALEWRDPNTVQIVVRIGDLRKALAALRKARGEA